MIVMKNIFGPYLEDLDKAQNLPLGNTNLEISFQGVLSMTPGFTTVFMQKILAWREDYPDLNLKITGLTQKLSSQIKSSPLMAQIR